MICYQDRSFCNHGDGCTCPPDRRYTPEVQAAADRWFGEPGAPVARGDLCGKRRSAPVRDERMEGADAR